MRDSVFRRWTGWKSTDGDTEDAFLRWVTGWTRVWGIFLVLGSLFPYGRPMRLIWFWQFAATGRGSELLVTIPAAALGLLALVFVARGRRPWLLGPLALGLFAHAGFMAIRAQAKKESFVAMPVDLIQLAMLIGAATALVAAGNHLLKRTDAAPGARILSGLGGVGLIAAYVAPVDKGLPLLLVFLPARTGLDLPYALSFLCFLLPAAYGVVGLLAAFLRGPGIRRFSSVSIRVLVAVIPLVPVASVYVFEGIAIREAWMVLTWLKSCLTIFGMLGLLAVGVVVWFRPGATELSEREADGPDPSGDAPPRPAP
jgi:hypothetical protein